MTSITLDKEYKGRKAGDVIDVPDLEIDAIVALGLATRAPALEEVDTKKTDKAKKPDQAAE